MSDIIQVLPDSVANQIAAGEVVQRPASVIKELLENSLDAGATRIQAIIADAGKTSIQVIDNGKGMSETDARLAFERHATSKIRNANDLYALTTMGFRGEALPSIAAVARVELRTRTADDQLGVGITIEGDYIHQEPLVCPIGANFCIKDLFYNIPVRRKFLRSNKWEQTLILSEFERIALAHPEVAMSLGTPEAVIMDLPDGTLRQRIVSVFGKNIDKNLLNIEVETPVVNIIGFVGRPESSKKKGQHQFFFVNGRFMRHPYFAKAVQTTYDRLVPEGEEVDFFLYLTIDPSRIDVNIHPTKTEIKFEDEQAIWAILQSAVREALGRFNAIPTIDFETAGRPDIPVYDKTTSLSDIKAPTINLLPDFNPFETGIKASGITPRTRREETHEFWTPPVSHTDPDLSAESPASLFAETENEEAADWDIDNSQFIQFRGRYIISPTDTGLLIINAHRAHIRILYDRYAQHSEDFAPDQLPALFEEEMLPSKKDTGEIIHDTILQRAQREAIQYNQPLSQDEMRTLVRDLFLTTNPNLTPDGKIILTILPHENIESKFR